jgi:hypothetical protein
MVRRPRSFKHAISAIGLALVASLALGALAAGSASAANQHWYSCQYVGAKKGSYEDQFCSKEVPVESGSYALTKLKAGVPEGFALNGTTSFTFKWSIYSLQFEIKCTTQKSENGTIENPVGGGAGTARLTFLFSSCTVVKPSNCTVKQPITLEFKGEATEFEGKPAVKFVSVGGGEALFTLSLEGEKCAGKGKSFVFYGSFAGIANNDSSSLEFTQASTAGITIGGKSASLEGTSKMETTSGKTLRLAP